MGIEINKSNIIPLILVLAPSLTISQSMIRLAEVNPTVSINWGLTALGTILFIIGFVMLSFKKKSD